jgi:hypothetical protein
MTNTATKKNDKKLRASNKASESEKEEDSNESSMTSTEKKRSQRIVLKPNVSIDIIFVFDIHPYSVFFDYFFRFSCNMLCIYYYDSNKQQR